MYACWTNEIQTCGPPDVRGHHWLGQKGKTDRLQECITEELVELLAAVAWDVCDIRIMDWWFTVEMNIGFLVIFLISNWLAICSWKCMSSTPMIYFNLTWQELLFYWIPWIGKCSVCLKVPNEMKMDNISDTFHTKAMRLLIKLQEMNGSIWLRDIVVF